MENMKTGKNYKFWFATGSQDLYGDECLKKVAEHSKIIVEGLNKSGLLPYEVVWKPTLITNEVIRKTFNEANADAEYTTKKITITIAEIVIRILCLSRKRLLRYSGIVIALPALIV